MNKKKGVKKMILKIFGILLLVIVLIIIGGVVTIGSIVSSSNKVHEPDEVVVKGGEKKALLIYQPSKSSMTKDASLKLADVLKEEGYTVKVNYPSDKLNYDLNDYDVLAFGSPVYAGQVSTVLKDYMNNNPVENKKIIVYSVGSIPNNQDELNALEASVKGSNDIFKKKYTKDTEDDFYKFIKECVK